MAVMHRIVVAGLLFGALPDAARAAEPRGGVRVAIVLEQPARSLNTAAMIAEADAIWRPHGVSVALASTREPQAAGVQLVLTIETGGRQSAPAGSRPAAGDVLGLGRIWFDEHGAPGHILSISLDAVALRLRQSRVNGRDLDAWPAALVGLVTARAVGRVLAHEIGHYLLALPGHSAQGLMRAAFDGRELGGWDRLAFQVDKRLLLRLDARLARLESAQQPLLATLP